MTTRTRAAACPEGGAAQRAAEAAWYALVDAERADLTLLRQHWLDWSARACQHALARHAQRSAPGGAADQAVAAIQAAYGGPAHVPAAVWTRLDAYTATQMLPRSVSDASAA